MKPYFIRFMAWMAVLSAFALTWQPDQAQAEEDRFSAGGYFRIAARPDFQGGKSKLGLWNISGRLLNESQWAALEMRLQLIKQTPGTNEVWTSLHAKIEGGSAHAADLLNGNLGNFALTQLYVKAGNVLIEDVIWQLGTLDFYFGDLGLYDMKFAEIFYHTVGLSATWSNDKVDLLVGIGDSGYLINPEGYSPALTFGTALRVKPVDGVEFGVGAEFMYSPAVEDSEYSPHQTRFDSSYNISYASFARQTVVQDFIAAYGSTTIDAAYPTPSAEDAFSFNVIGYLGFGKLGALKWNNLFLQFKRLQPEQFYYDYDPVSGIEKRVFIKDWTDERYQFNIGDEMHLAIVPDRFDLTWAAIFGYHFDKDDDIRATENNRMIWSLVARGQVYITPVTHILVETSFAQEHSLNGNLWRKGARSPGTLNIGTSTEGFQYGDLDTRNTWQGKLGLVLNPGGTGIFARPSLRLLYGVQYSNVHNAFENTNVVDVDNSNEFYHSDFTKMTDRHWHHVISIEAEAWF